uniref:Uncharacterized protein n=1 Tax=Heterorhabditis bacteriophora TaxID=37862 RepID=A0A1I7WD85_HETBA
MEAPAGLQRNHHDPPTRYAIAQASNGLSLKRHPFSGLVSCYTLLSGYRLPWPPSCCLYQPTPFMGSHERKVRHLNPAASSAYQKWPTWSTRSCQQNRDIIPIESLRIGCRSPLIIRFTGYNHAPLLQLSWGKLRREPATRRLSPLYPSLSIDLHFPLASSFHHLSADKTGPWCAAPKSGSHVNRLTGFSPPLDSRINYTPRSVFQDGSERWELALR